MHIYESFYTHAFMVNSNGHEQPPLFISNNISFCSIYKLQAINEQFAIFLANVVYTDYGIGRLN